VLRQLSERWLVYDGLINFDNVQTRRPTFIHASVSELPISFTNPIALVFSTCLPSDGRVV
jgi:hypothetical protein